MKALIGTVGAPVNGLSVILFSRLFKLFDYFILLGIIHCIRVEHGLGYGIWIIILFGMLLVEQFICDC